MASRLGARVFTTKLAALMAALALVLVTAVPVFAAHTVDLGASGTDQSGLCEGDFFKIESTAILEEGTHTFTGTTANGESFTAVLTVTLDEDGEVDTITVVSTDPDFDLIVFKAGDVTFTTEGNVIDADQAISNVAFCLVDEPPVVIPEAPFAVILPGVIVAGFAAYLFLNRRRTANLV